MLAIEKLSCEALVGEMSWEEHGLSEKELFDRSPSDPMLVSIGDSNFVNISHLREFVQSWNLIKNLK